MLELKGVSKRYKKKIVIEKLDATFPAGVTVLTGPSGIGKTTLLRLCATVEKPSKGIITWNGQNIFKNKRAFRSGLGYAPQIIDFPDNLSAMDFMAHLGALKGMKMPEIQSQSKDLLGRVGLSADLDNSIQTFSGGMRRRLGLAQAFLGSPKCLVIDEPTAELDVQTAQKIYELIFEFGSHASVVMATHLESSLSEFKYRKLHLDHA